MSDRAARGAVGTVGLDREVLAVSGPEAEAYLQGQLSQDVASAGAADSIPSWSVWSWLLAPNGKVDALLRVTRAGPEEWLIDTDAGWGQAVRERLNRFKLRTKVDIAATDARVVGLRGPGWEQVRIPDGFWVVSPPWPGVEGADLIGSGERPADLPVIDPADHEADRIRAGMPKMGAELDERTIPAETGLVALTVSFTKGCYTGQELVARIDSRGSNVARRLRGLRFDDGTAHPVTPGTGLLGPDGAAAVGTVTSVAHSETDGWVGLGYVRRGVDVSERLTRAGAPGAVRQVELPF